MKGSNFLISGTKVEKHQVLSGFQVSLVKFNFLKLNYHNGVNNPIRATPPHLEVFLKKYKNILKIFLGFSFPQAFLTAALQNYARDQQTAIDLLSFEFIIDDKLKPSDITEKPKHGVYVYGMFLEGARWNFDNHCLEDSLPKELYTDVPMILFRPVEKRVAPTSGVYFCPLYKVLSRAGTLSTTGHSTNYVLYVELPTDRDQGVWIKAGVAMFLALRQ